MKYTAANNSLLAVIKREYNAKIYKHALAIYNAESQDATIAYLQQFSTIDIKPGLLKQELTEQQRQADDRARKFRHLIR